MDAQTLLGVNQTSAKLVQTPGKPGDLNDVLQHIAQTAQEAFASDACVIMAINPITGSFISSQMFMSRELKEKTPSHINPRPQGITQHVLSGDGVLLIEDLEAEPEFHGPFTRREGMRSFAGIAMRTMHRSRPLGVIYLDFKQPKKFSSADYESFRIFAVQASFLLQETWLENNLIEIARIGQDINHDLDTVDDLFQHLQTFVDAILDNTHMLLLAVYQPQTNTVDFHVRAQGTYSFINSPLNGATKHTIDTQESFFIRHLSEQKDDLPFKVVNITGTEERESFIFVPLSLRGLSLGVLSIQHAIPNAYGQEDLFILQSLANYIALALHNMRLYHGLNQLNETGLLLTRQLESEQTLQATVDKIREATQSDIVILYPYESETQHSLLPARIAGNFLDQNIELIFPRRPDDIAFLMLNRKEPIFAKVSSQLYSVLQGNIHIRQGNFQEREQVSSTAALPLQVGDETVGILFVNFREPQRFDATQKLFIEGLAHYAAIAIKNSQVFRSLSMRRLRELEILQYIDRELSHTLDLDTVLNTLLRLAHEHVPSEEASILLHKPQMGILETAVAIGPHAEASRKQVINLSETKGITRWVVEHKKAAHVKNVHKDENWKGLHVPVAAGIISELDVPLLDGDEVTGVLNFESTREGAFHQEDQDFLLTLAGQAVLAIKNAQAYQREKRLAEERRVVNEISKQIIGQLDLSHVFDLILEKALELTHSTTGVLVLLDKDQNDMWMAAEQGVSQDKKGRRFSMNQGIVGYAATTRQALIVDPSQPPWNDIYLDYIPGTRSELAVPMLASNQVLGVLDVESPAINNFAESDERLLKALADLAVVALQNARAYEREKRLAEEAQVLNEISKEITSQLDHLRVFDLIIERALELTHSSLGTLWLYDPDQNMLWMASERGLVSERKSKNITLDEGIVGYVAKNKTALLLDPTEPPWNEIYQIFVPGTRSELTVPMLAGVELRGVLNIESTHPNNFNERDERLLKGLADLAVVSLQNVQAFEREKRLLAEAQVLNEISKEISSQLDLVNVFNFILEKTLELTHSTLGSLHLYDPDQHDLWIATERGVQEDKKDQRQRMDQGVVGYAATNKQLLNVADISQPPWNEIYLDFIPIVHSELAVPMLAGNELLGVLNVESPHIRHFSERDERLLRGLADLAVVALQNARAYEREKRLVAESQMLNDISKEITSQLDHVHVFDLILERMLELTNCILGILLLYDRESDELRIVAERGLGADQQNRRIPLSQGIVGKVAMEKRLLNVPDVFQEPWKHIYLPLFSETRSELAVPMLAGNELRGVLNVESKVLRHFKESDEQLLQGLADLAVVALQNAEHYKEAEREAQRFELLYQAGQELSKITDLAQLDQAYDTILEIAQKQSQSLVVIRRYDEITQELELIRASQPDYAALYRRANLDVGINGQVAREKRTIVLPDVDHPPPGVVLPQLSDPSTRSLLITPIRFKEQYYGNLGLDHKEVGHFLGADTLFFEGLAQQLANTIHRLETVKVRQEFEQRAISAEEMSSIGQSAFEVTHRLGNDLGLVDLYVSDIKTELDRFGIADNEIITRKLEDILQSVQTVLSFSGDLKQELARSGTEEAAGLPVKVSPRVLLEEIASLSTLPSNVQLCLEIEDDVAAVRVIRSMVADILRNLVVNAIQAMPKEGGKITLRSHNIGRSVAIEVADTGVGIHPDRLPMVFDLFFSTKGSSGFGLWSARRNALKNHGILKVESKLGEGTTFILLLPGSDVGEV